MEGRARAFWNPFFLLTALCVIAIVWPSRAWPKELLVGELVDGRFQGTVAQFAGLKLWHVALTFLAAFFMVAGATTQPSLAYHEPRRHRRSLLVALVVSAFVMRLVGLDRGLWYDEAWMHVDLIRDKPLTYALRNFPSDNHHPLYTILAWCSVQLFGEHTFALRLPAVLFGALSVGMLYVFAAARTRHGEALLAALCLLVSHHHLSASQDARGYTALLFFTLLSSHLFLRMLARSDRRTWCAYGVSLALTTFVHLTGVYVAIAHALLYLGALRKDSGLRRSPLRRTAPLYGFVLALLLSSFLHALFLPEMYAFFTEARPERAPFDWRKAEWMWEAIVSSLGVSAPVAYALLALAGAFLAIGLVSTWRSDRAIVWLLVLPALASVFFLFVLERNLWPRFFLNLAGFGLMIAARALSSCCSWLSSGVRDLERAMEWRRRAFYVGSCVVLAGLTFLSLRAASTLKEDYEGALRWMMANRSTERPEPLLSAGLTDKPLEYFRGLPGRSDDTAWRRLGVQHVKEPGDARRVLGRSSGFLLMGAETYLASKHEALWNWLQTHAILAAKFPGSKATLYVLYVTPGEPGAGE
ncbi:MAG: glycosyltransferase family 39 protein [Planctomycetes bacterium]|nr:glycosyltransferase family 39 protein [Planctomycetota bacterium]